MKLSLATVSIAGDLRQKCEAIARAGLDGIEIFEQDLIAAPFGPKAIGDMIRDLGLEITLFQPFRDFEGLPEPMRSRAFARAERKFDLMTELGCDLMLVCSNTQPEALGGIDRAADDLRALAERAEARGLRLGYEALAWGRHVNDHRDAWEIVRRADHPALGLILDSFHTLTRGIDVDTIRRIPGDRIFYVHLADAPRIDMDLLYLSRHFRCMPLEGDLDIIGFTRAVLSTGYDGVFSPEIFNDQFRSGVASVIARDGFRSVMALMDAVARSAPELAPALPRMPAPQQVQEVSFLEFATSDSEKQVLEQFLHSAGFDKAGTHISKPVTLWRQGGANLLVNTADTGHAHNSWVNHGTCINEIALKVPDARAVQARARALGSTVQDSTAHDPGEMDIPALRSLGGGLIRLLDDGPELGNIWMRDFHIDAPTKDMGSAKTGQGAGASHIDHVAQTMPYNDMLGWVLFYTSLFDARKASIVDVVDPAGLVRSQAVETGKLRLTLNGTDNHRTVAGRFLGGTFGAPVHHVAFATPDIFATSAILKQRGFDRLHLGANYYADLTARFDLSAEFSARLEKNSILYDEDARGSFLQIFSKTRPEGLFFEFVQRNGQYAGYGAANAPYRVAAQRRNDQTDGLPSR